METCRLALLAFRYCSDSQYTRKIQLGQIWGGCQQRKVLHGGQQGLCKDKLSLLDYVLRTRPCVVALLL